MWSRKNAIRYLFVALLVWAVIALVAKENPVPQEPEDLPEGTWSYYNHYPDYIEFLIRNRDAILVILFLCSIIPDIILLILSFVRK